jgi:hypothetical protein
MAEWCEAETIGDDLMEHNKKHCTCKDCRPLEFALKYSSGWLYSGGQNIRLHRDQYEAQMAFCVIEQLRDPKAPT